MTTPRNTPFGATTPVGHTEEVVATRTSYVEAQRVVDLLSDEQFPVESVRIVGHDLRLVERVTGRLTNGRAALYGAGSGAWVGLLIGLVISFFTIGAWFWPILVAVVLGAIFGAVFGFAGHAATGGRRDFSSVQGLEAARYDIAVDTTLAERARGLVERLG